MIQCTFTSVWEDMSITSSLVYNPETGEVVPDTVDVNPSGCLVREYITLPDGTELEVCSTCHEYVMRKIMAEGVGKQLSEVAVCANSECESHL